MKTVLFKSKPIRFELNRIYFPESVPKECPDNIYKSVAMSVLSALSTDADVVSSTDAYC